MLNKDLCNLKKKSLKLYIFMLVKKKIIIYVWFLLQIHTVKGTILETTKRKFRENIPNYQKKSSELVRIIFICMLLCRYF